MNNCLLIAVVLATMGAGLDNGHNLAASILCWILVTSTISGIAVLSAIYLVLTNWEY